MGLRVTSPQTRSRSLNLISTLFNPTTRLDLSLTRRAINHRSNGRILIQLGEELARLLVIPNLGKLEGNGTRPVRRPASLLDCVSNSVEDGVSRLTGWLAVCDGNDQDWLAHLSTPQAAKEDSIDDLLAKFRSHWGESAEFVASKKLLHLLLGLETIDQMVRWGLVHEPDIDSVFVKQGRCERDTLKDQLKILDTLSLLLELHRATVVNVDDYVVQRELDEVISDLLLDAPSLAQAIDLR